MDRYDSTVSWGQLDETDSAKQTSIANERPAQRLYLPFAMRELSNRLMNCLQHAPSGNQPL